MSRNTAPILLVEDDQNDVFFLQHAFEAAGIANRLQVVEDGEQAINYLAGQGQFTDRSGFPLPCLVLLDLNLPLKTGLDVLRWLHEQPSLQTLLFIVLTSSQNSRDIDEAYRLGARSFLVKPHSLEQRLNMAKAIKVYWLEMNEFPTMSQECRESKVE
jgi:CheY-like chemotaxis protein